MRTLVMKLSYIFFSIFFVTTNCVDVGSYEVNQIELTPLHDAIIFNDIADIMNEFENNMKPSLNKYVFSDSESGEEDIEELLSEYQHYLDKAHKKRIIYEEKSKGKNKIPLKRREKYSKLKESARSKYNDVPNDYFNTMKYFQKSFPPPLSLFMSRNGKVSIDKNLEFTDINSQPHAYEQVSPNKYKSIQKNEGNEVPYLFPIISRPKHERITSSCYCKVDQIPCECNCKQCFVSTNSLPSKYFKKYNNNQNVFIENHLKTAKYVEDRVVEDKLNIRIKIDVQLPKLTELGWMHNSQNQDKTAEGEWIPSKEMISTINLPFPYLNFPKPVELFGDSQIKQYNNKRDSTPPIRKITIHKKKKPRFGSNNKKHMGKKIISFHSFKLDQPIGQNFTDVNNNSTSNISKNSSMNSYIKEIKESKLQLTKNLNDEALKSFTNNKTTTALPLENSNASIGTIFLKVNISKMIDNDTNESIKLENSIETEFVEKNNKSITKALRLKRETIASARTGTLTNTNKTVVHTKQNMSMEVYTKELKTFDKTLAGEMELLYWPAEIKNATLVKFKNITNVTALILERENKKAKLNMTYDKIRNNRIKALEQAVFGQVDWNDVDTVAPVFMSFVGKYIRGVLTFCSQSICHSMKCAAKTCLHRICSPDNRLNHKGHCTGNNDTDSVAAMESIMDLPTNVVFEIVDILQDKMLGKMYGKATLCIISKCSTFIASKKLFQKSKCIYKELSSSGHCPIVKNVKMI